MQQILSYMRKAIEDYNMIEEGDKIAVALSGGKDSISLLMGLKNLQRFYPKHFEDDVLETFLLNLLYTGSINTFAPVSYMDRSKITLIRPLIYAPEKYMKKFIKKNEITVMSKVCPMDGYSKREDIKKMISDLKVDIPHIRANLYGAIKRNIPQWKKPE